MCVMLTPEVQEKIIEKVSSLLPYVIIFFIIYFNFSLTFFFFFQFPQYNITCVTLKAGENCNLLVGYVAVYRVSFAMAAFFFIMAFLTIGVSSSNSWRAGLHNG